MTLHYITLHYITHYTILYYYRCLVKEYVTIDNKENTPDGMCLFQVILCIIVNFCKASCKKNDTGKTLGVWLFIQLCKINLFPP